MVVVEAISPLDTAVVRDFTSACRAVGLMATAAGAATTGSFDSDVLDEVVN